MANFLNHEPCPNCGSKDNLACYDDGSKWCFGCRYYIPPVGLIRLQNKFKSVQDIETNFGINLPDDATYQLQQNHIDWLSKYSITRSEIILYRLMSSKEKGLILPIYNKDSELIFYVNRPMKEGMAKSFDNGRKPFVVFQHKKQPVTNKVVLVEDYVSAMKVARVCPAVPLFGSFVSLKAISSLSPRFSECLIWLDRDKAKESLKQALRFFPYFKQGARSVITDLDPKEYKEQEIKQYLNI